MITIDQLLESVNLNFEPRFVTKDASGEICIWDDFKPYPDEEIWNNTVQSNDKCFGELKLSEFDGKDWTECIYEVPRNTTGKIEKIPDEINLQTGEYGKVKFDIIPKETFAMVCRKINEVIDAVNELKGGKNE